MIRKRKSVKSWQFMGGLPCCDSSNGFWGRRNAGDLIKQPRKALPFFCLPIMSLFIIGASGAWAADVKLTPQLAVGGAYDDNILLSTDNKLSSSIVTVSPGVEMDVQTLLSTLRLKADWDILSYLDESDLDRTNHYYRLSASHRIKERWTTAADFRFYRDTTLNTFLQETGRVNDRVERDYFDAGGSVGYNLTKISNISARYRYETAVYERDVFTDYDRHFGSLYYSHRLKNERDTLSIGPSYYHRTNDFNDVDSYALDIGWARDWSAITRSDASIGARQATVKRDDGTEDDSWGARARFDFTYKGIVSTTTIRYFHDLRTTVDGNDINVDNVYLTYRRSLTERFGVGMDGRLVFSYKLVNQQADINGERYYWLEPRLFYRLTENFDLSLRYRYQNNVEFRDEGDLTRERNIIWLQLSYALPMLL
jgi:hypothetical protein